MIAKPLFFTRFIKPIGDTVLPTQLTLIQNNEAPHPLCALAAKELQDYLENQTEWQHNFGLDESGQGTVIGKMFGVLVVQNTAKEIGYLAAFSGKLAGSNSHSKFVPPVFDLLTENGFLNKGMEELTAINIEIKALKELDFEENKEEINKLKAKRKQHSIALQKEIFNQYHFLNEAGEEKSLIDIFATAGYKNPPAGAGECAGPKLLQYAFQHHLKPLALTEFWWGLSPKSATWKHKEFYPCCKEKCGPILAHMLKGI
ncbi:pseudouridylate synthase [Pedobacter sp. LMG 31464]|uniref:Pseudouridylate synthase n=1 Tax=Pedobacter planticolens TaxID=2679964 RepID=A0A923E2W3_9SPHI|nr:pseudouridylate synthase [Pedobacter planticolens]MBB2147048.1 pseudouridylate synthase [Pedobacter planticolens]